MTTDHHVFDDGGYTPDAERDTAILLDAFVAHIANAVRERALPDRLPADVIALHHELEAVNAHLIDDEPSRHNLRITLALVAAYRVLLPHLARDEAVAVVRDAIVEPLGALTEAATAAMLDAAPDPFAAMVAMSKSREKESFGRTFAFVRPADDDRRYFLDIHRCFYHDVLVANSAPELTPAMCAFDLNWIRAIDPARHGLRFDRAGTIGHGDPHCAFHFHRTDSPESSRD
ncbi:L-2-amino-thiazoline-4-carboxylic acid hydrolase [Embleya sp. NPDC008237]|uniref:L-2-amino-thiazoline-4-carboxylic acid hydrolase n=1 Tax=Embleya sp. NPDC008237 TaxID=3363978 RepID=UPI0036E6801D